jgi:hypothetical protein
MPVENRQIASGAITDSKVSKNAGIKGSKLEVAEPGQILVADDKGRFQPKHLDLTPEKDCCEGAIKGIDIEPGKILVGTDDGVPIQIPAIPEPELVVKTDPIGVIEETVTIPIKQVTPSPVETSAVVITDSANNNQTYSVNQISQVTTKGHLEFVTPSSPGVIKSYTFDHNLGYKPDVLVLEHDSQVEIETQISVTENTATVDLSDSGQRLRVIVQ